MTQSLTPSTAVVCALLVAGAAASIASAAASGEGFATEYTVPTHWGPQVFRVTDADAGEAAAFRINRDRVTKDGFTPPATDGYAIRSTVVVTPAHGVGAAELRQMAAGHGSAAIRAVPESPGWYLIDVQSISLAVDLATAWQSDPRINEAYVDISSPQSLRTLPTDPGFTNQWHLHNTSDPVADVNAEPAWDAGYTGDGVIVGVIEGGWELTHDDLAPNYHAEASQSFSGDSSHATSVAGVIAAVANNGLGGVGVAYDAKISRIRYGSSSQNAQAFGYRNDLNDIKNNSWGPWDTGEIYYISSIELNALEDGCLTGRDGKGEIYAWAAGNGGLGDRVDYDPYASSRYTLAIGAIGDQDRRASYNEVGSSMLVVAHSSGNGRGIYTTTTGNGYTSSFGGTSSASPLGAGVVALMLEANPDLTWRDVQHVLIESARICHPSDAQWTTNGAGHDINYNYGFGAIDAEAATTLAASWTLVAPETSATAFEAVNLVIPDDDTTGMTRSLTIDGEITLEAVEVILNVTTPYVGDLRVTLTSPEGTNSVFSTPRGDAQDDLDNYRFTSLRHWGENASGTWTLIISDEGSGDVATWIDWQLIVYGTDGVAIPGDIDGDGDVDISDLGALLASFGLPVDDPNFNPDADLDGDDDVDISDLGLLLANFTG
jgi:subtilisin-like proprotein convertase family protein